MGTVNKNSSATITPVFSSEYSLYAPAKITIFEGEIDSWGLTESKVNITATNILSRWARRTLSVHSSSCRWKKFKGTECGYTGAQTWCDRSFSRCSALNNTSNFGGFRWLPSIVDKEIWWGKVPENE